MLASCLFGAALMSSWAGTGSINATASVGTNCTIAASALTFGAYDPIQAHVSTALNGSSSVTITCVKGTAASIGLSLGAQPLGTTRRMASGVDFLAYALYQPPDSNPGTACAAVGTKLWGPSAPDLFNPPAAPNKNSRAFNVCGTVPAGQNVAVGTYSDTVVATVTF